VYAGASRLGFDIVKRHYYSPIPDLRSLPDGTFERESDLPGIDLRLDAALELLEKSLAPYVAEFNPARTSVEPGTFFVANGVYETIDAEVLYALVRHLKPSRMIELGSGFSTLVELQACDANRREGHETRLTVFDPYPGSGSGEPLERFLAGAEHRLPDWATIERVPATEVPLRCYEELEAGDVLFVDTTHTVKLGSDVNHVILEILPRLAPGVVVHIHDVFLPYEYPRRWFEDRLYWAEQYLLQAFLAFNHDFEVLFPARAVATRFGDRVARIIPSFDGTLRPHSAGAFWLRRRPGPENRA
jgi:hypothetical protein